MFEFLQQYEVYIMVLIFTIISTIFYSIRNIYLARESTKEVLIFNGIYICVNTLVTRNLVQGSDTALVVLVSLISSEIGYFCGLFIKNKFDPSISNKEDKMWLFSIECEDKLADKFMKAYGESAGIKRIRINETQQQFVCSSKERSKYIRNFIEIYQLKHTIEEIWNFKNKKLSYEEGITMKNKIDSMEI